MNTSSLCVVGKILKPKGLKGHLKVHSYTQDPFFICSLDLYDENQRFLFQLHKVGTIQQPDKIEVRIDQVCTPEAARALQNYVLYARIQDFPEIQKPDEFYCSELVGMQVLGPDQQMWGKVLRVDNFGAGDLLDMYCEKNKKTYYVPFKEPFVMDVCREKRVVFLGCWPEDDF
jgi:16S rRNA processing protein RimM